MAWDSEASIYIEIYTCKHTAHCQDASREFMSRAFEERSRREIKNKWTLGLIWR